MKSTRTGEYSSDPHCGDRVKTAYEKLFGPPALALEPEQRSPYEVGNPTEPPPDPPPLLRASEPARAAFEALFPIAYQYASDHALVMQGVRKALKKGHEAAEEAGGLEL